MSEPIDYSKEPLLMIITRGFPGSGKSTWANDHVRTARNFVRVCRDDIRTMMFGTNNQRSRQYDKSLEEVVRSVRDHLIAAAMCAGSNVVVDETGVYKHSLQRLWKLADAIQADCERPVNVVFKSFLHVPLEECIRRDALRENPVGEDVIRSMLKKHLEEQESQTE